MSRQADYQQVQAEAAVKARDAQVAGWVREVRRRQPRVGTRKLHYLLREPMADAGLKLGRDALFGTLKRLHLLVPPQRAFHKTTDSWAPEMTQANLPEMAG